MFLVYFSRRFKLINYRTDRYNTGGVGLQKRQFERPSLPADMQYNFKHGGYKGHLGWNESGWKELSTMKTFRTTLLFNKNVINASFIEKFFLSLYRKQAMYVANCGIAVLVLLIEGCYTVLGNIELFNGEAFSVIPKRQRGGRVYVKLRYNIVVVIN